MVVKERVFAIATDGDYLWAGGKARIITKFEVRKEISFSKTECCPEVQHILPNRLRYGHCPFLGSG